MQALAQEIDFSETIVRAPGRGGRHGARPHLHPDERDAVRGASRSSATAWVLAAAAPARRRRARDGQRHRARSTIERDESGALVFGRMQQPVPDGRALPETRMRSSPRSASTASVLPVERYDNGPTHTFVVARVARRGRCARTRSQRHRASSRSTPAASPARGRRWKSRMFAPALGAGGPGDRLGGRPARLPPRPTRARALGDGDRDLAGRRDRPAVDALRASRRRRRTGSSGSRWAAAQSSSREASSGLADAESRAGVDRAGGAVSRPATPGRDGDPPPRDVGRRAALHVPAVAARPRAAGRRVRRPRGRRAARVSDSSSTSSSGRGRPGDRCRRTEATRGSRRRSGSAWCTGRASSDTARRRRSTTPQCVLPPRTRLRPGSSDVRPDRAQLEIGELRLAPGVPARLDAGGFDRHTFLCGQSGSGKTYSLGVILERLLLETSLRIVVLDPNSDFVASRGGAAGRGRGGRAAARRRRARCGRAKRRRRAGRGTPGSPLRGSRPARAGRGAPPRPGRRP